MLLGGSFYNGKVTMGKGTLHGNNVLSVNYILKL